MSSHTLTIPTYHSSKFTNNPYLLNNMDYSCSIAVAPGKDLKACSSNGGLDVYLFILATLFSMVILAWLLFIVCRAVSLFVRSVATKVCLVSEGLYTQVLYLRSSSSARVSSKLCWSRPSPLFNTPRTLLCSVLSGGMICALRVLMQCLSGLWSFCAGRLFAPSAYLERTVVFLRSQVASLHDILRLSNERSATLSALLREAQATISARDDAIRDLKTTISFKDNTIYDLDATLADKDIASIDFEASVHTPSISISANVCPSFSASEKTLADFRLTWDTAISAIRSRTEIIRDLQQALAHKNGTLAITAENIQLLQTALADARKGQDGSHSREALQSARTLTEEKDASLKANESEVYELTTELSALRAAAIVHDVLLSNAGDALRRYGLKHDAALESKKEAEARAYRLNMFAKELKTAVKAQNKELKDIAKKNTELKAIIKRREASLTRRDQELARKDCTIAVRENEVAAARASAQKERIQLATQLKQKDTEFKYARMELEASLEVVDTFQSDFEAYEAETARIRKGLEDKLKLRDMEIERLKTQLAFPTQRDSQSESVVGPLGASAFAPSSPPRPAQSSSSPAISSASPTRSSSTSSPIQSLLNSSTRSSSLIVQCSTATVRPCAPTHETSFTIEDKLAEMDVSCDLMHENFSLADAGSDLSWAAEEQEDEQEDKCPLGSEDVASRQELPCLDKPSFSIPVGHGSRDLLNDKDYFLAHDRDSHWLKDTPEKPKVVVKLQDVLASVESSFCAGAKKPSLIMRIDDVSCDLLHDNMSFLKDEDSVWCTESAQKPVPIVKRKAGKTHPTSAPGNSWGEPRAAGEKSSFVMSVQSDDSLNDKLPSNLSADFAQLVENASTPAKRSRRHAKDRSPESPRLSSAPEDASAFTSLKPHQSASRFLTPEYPSQASACLS